MVFARRLMPPKPKPSLIDLNLNSCLTNRELKPKGSVSSSRSSRLTSSARPTSVAQKRSESSVKRPKARPDFIICTHIKSDCSCVRRTKSQENVENTNKSKRPQKRKSLNFNMIKSSSIKEVNQTLDTDNLKTNIKFRVAPDYYSRDWNNMIEEASIRVYDVNIGNHKTCF